MKLSWQSYKSKQCMYITAIVTYIDICVANVWPSGVHLHPNTLSHRHTGRQTDARRGRMKQILVQLTPFTTPDIPLTVRELQQLRHTTPGGTFDVYPLSLLGRWGGGASSERVQNCVCFHSLPLSRFQSLLNSSPTIAAGPFDCC